MGLFKKKKKETEQIHSQYAVVGLPYHDAPKIMENEESFSYSKREIEEEGGYAAEKTYSSLASLVIEHGEYEGAVQVHTKDGFIGYIPKESCSHVRKIMEHDIEYAVVCIRDGKRYILDDDGDLETFNQKMDADLEIIWLDTVDNG